MAKQATAVSSRPSSRPTRSTARPTRRPQPADVSKVQWNIPFTAMNLIILGAGIAIITIGYLLMSSGIPEDPAHVEGIWNKPVVVDVAPVLLAIGYCILIPLGIFYRRKGEPTEETQATTNA